MNRVREWWDSLGRNNQIILVASSVGILVALVGFIAWAGTPEYVPLFSDLTAQNANTISDKLKEANVPFRLIQNGTGIEVPAQQRDELRIKMASQIPELTAGLGGNQDSVMQGANPLETSKMEEVRILKMHENEISHSITTLQQVSAATVRIAPPIESAFADSKHDATASVMVTLKPGQQLSEENVRAIVRITQFSTPGLSDKGIVVADSRGNALWDPANSENAGAGDRIKDQHTIAQTWETKIQRMLDTTIGPHKTTVAVNAELDPVHKTVRTKEASPGAILTKTNSTEELIGQGQTNKGATPGANANLAGATVPGAGTPVYGTSLTGDKSNYKREETTSTSEPTITETESQLGDGRIEKLTVSAFVDSSVPADEISNIKQAMETMIGVDPSDATHARMVTVAQIPFDHTVEDQEKKSALAEQSTESTAKLLSIAIPVGILMLCLFLLARALRRPMRLATGGQLALPGGGSMAYSTDGMPMALMADGTPTPGQMVGSMLGADNEPIGLVIGAGPKTYDVIEEAFDSNLESILHLTKSKPETVAALIKGWISEDQG